MEVIEPLIPLDVVYDSTKYFTVGEKWVLSQIPYFSDLYELNYNVRRGVVNHAISINSWNLFNWALSRFLPINWKSYILAIKVGNLEFVKILHYFNCEWDNSAFEYSILKGKIEFVKFFYTNKKDYPSFDTYLEKSFNKEHISILALNSGNVEIVKYLTNIKLFTDTFNIIYQAGLSGNLDMVKYIENNHKYNCYYQVKYRNILVESGAEIGSTEIINHSISKGFPPSTCHCVYIAALGGNFDIMFYLMDMVPWGYKQFLHYIATWNRIDILEKVKEKIALGGETIKEWNFIYSWDPPYPTEKINLEVYDWALENNGKLRLSLLYHACDVFDIPSIKYLTNYGIIPDETCIKKVLKFCCRDTINFLLSKNSKLTINFDILEGCYGIENFITRNRAVDIHTVKHLEEVKTYLFTEKHLDFYIWIFNEYKSRENFRRINNGEKPIESVQVTIPYKDDVFYGDKVLLEKLRKNGINIIHK